MAAELEDAFDAVDVTMIPAGGGLFEVIADGALVFSKKAIGRHAEPGEVVGLIRSGHRAV